MHDAVSAEAVDEIETGHVRRRSNNRVMVRGHLVKPRPCPAWIDSRFGEHRDAGRGMSQDLLDKSFVELSLETWCFFRVVPGQENPLPFPAKMKAGGHIDHHGESLW